jgi:hypothetical protein
MGFAKKDKGQHLSPIPAPPVPFGYKEPQEQDYVIQGLPSPDAFHIDPVKSLVRETFDRNKLLMLSRL